MYLSKFYPFVPKIFVLSVNEILISIKGHNITQLQIREKSLVTILI